MSCLYGGTAGNCLVLQPQPTPPAKVCRIVPGSVWWTLIHWPWRQYLAAIASGVAVARPPLLASPMSMGVFVTDPPSLEGCFSPADFALRMALYSQAQLDCLLHGCAVVEFDLPPPANLSPLPAKAGVTTGMTGGGAREWLLTGNIALDLAMKVYYVEKTQTSPRHYEIHL